MYSFDLRTFNEFLLPGTVLVCAVVPLLLGAHPLLQRLACLLGGGICLILGLTFAVFGGVILLPTAVFLFVAAGRGPQRIL